MDRVKQEYKYWNDIAKSSERDIHICDAWVTPEKCLELILPPLKDCGCVLEIGCGVGRLTIPISKTLEDAQLYGVDISNEMVKVAKKNAKGLRNVSFKANDGRTIPYDDNYFDGCYTMITLQHIDEEGIKSYFKEVSRVMKKGGVFRFQFVEGNENSAFSQQFDSLTIEEWLNSYSFKVKEAKKGLIYNNWVWVTAIKQ